MASDPSTNPTPAPAIGKIGPYTVFLTPPPSSPKHPLTVATSPEYPAAAATAVAIPGTPKKVAVHTPPFPPAAAPPPVLPPPALFDKPDASDRLDFFRNAVIKVHNAHSSLDEYVAGWLGLNQSKYQWALDDYYESKM